MIQQLLNTPLLTDLYELTMAGAYFHNRMEQEASFELFVRNLPENRSCLIAVGLEQALDFLEQLHFEPEEIEYLRQRDVFQDIDPQFFDYLSALQFEGKVEAVPEGTLVFDEEPIVRVTAPILQAQVVETYLLATIGFQTMITSKAARVVEASAKDGKERSVIDFGSRRAHGPEAGVLAARACYLAGCIGTSNTFAGLKFGIPIFGTAAHSWTMSFPTEEESIEAYLRAFPNSALLLVDTYDSIEGVKKGIRIAGENLKGIRLDSGDMVQLSRESRKLLDEAGLKDAKIVASGNLNEDKIAMLIDADAPIDIFGVGTEMVTSRDEPSVGVVYKLIEIIRDGKPMHPIKLSEEKATYPGKKQICRFFNEEGKIERDLLIHESEEPPEGSVPLMQTVMEKGERTFPSPEIEEIRKNVKMNLKSLPEGTILNAKGNIIEPERSDRVEQVFRQARERFED